MQRGDFHLRSLARLRGIHARCLRESRTLDARSLRSLFLGGRAPTVMLGFLGLGAALPKVRARTLACAVMRSAPPPLRLREREPSANPRTLRSRNRRVAPRVRAP